MNRHFHINGEGEVIRTESSVFQGKVHATFKTKCEKTLDLLECLKNTASNASFPAKPCCEKCKREKEAIDVCIHTIKDFLYMGDKWLRHLAFYGCLDRPTYHSIPKSTSYLESVMAEAYDHFQPFAPYEDDSVLVSEEVDSEIVLKEKRDWYLLELELDTSNKSRGENYTDWLVKVYESQRHSVMPVIDDKGDLVCHLNRNGPTDVQSWRIYVKGGRSVCLRVKNWDYRLSMTLNRVGGVETNVPVFITLGGYPREVINKGCGIVDKELTPILSMLKVERDEYTLEFSPYTDSLWRRGIYK